MILSVLAFVAGIISVQQLSVLPGRNEILIIIVLLLVFARQRYWRLMLFTIGVLWVVIFALIRVTDILPEQLEGKDITVQGVIDGLPVSDGNRVKFNFIVSYSESDLPEKLRLSWYFPNRKIKAGQYWRLTVRLKKPHGRFNPGGFDYERWLFSHNIGAVGYVRNKPAPVLMDRDHNRQGFEQWRQSIADQLNKILIDSRYTDIIKALTIGDRSSMSRGEWDVFRKTGTAHLVAISGLHIGLIAGLVYFLALKAWAYTGILTFSPQKMAVICALMAAFFYAALAGFALPTQRALIMLTVAMAAIYRQQHIAPMQTIAMALLGVVLLDPLAVLSASFWLSFLAVALILYSLSARLGRLNRWNSVVKIHWVMAVGMAPMLMLYFQQVSLIAPLANLLAVPVISLLVVPLSLLAILLVFGAPSLSEQLFLLVDGVLHYLWLFLSACAGLPLAALMTVQPPLYAVALATLGVFLLLAPKGVPARYLGLVFCLPIFFVDVDKPASGEVRITLLDVGQGLAVVVETRNHVLLFDTGAKFSPQFNMGTAVILPYLRFQRITKVDTLLISHGDNDHIGGAESILTMIPVGEVISSVQEMHLQHQARYCQSGQHWEWDGVRFNMLSPPQQGFFQSANDNSCVLKVSTAEHAFLLAGDIEHSTENWLVKQYGTALKSSVLIAPHHGSKTSSSLVFLEQVEPEIVLIPAGYRNRFSFPHEQVLQRYRQQHISWFNTSKEGAIIVNTDRETLLIESSREKYRKYWLSE